jgi:hypothetical protein
MFRRRFTERRVPLLIAYSAVGAMTLCGSLAASAATSAATGSAQTRAAGSASCAPGDTLATPTAASTDSLGVRHYTYRAMPGLVTKIPPAGLTAAHATPALLADIGVKNGSGAAQQAVALSKGSVPALCLSKKRPASPEAVLANGSSKAGSSTSTPRFDHFYSANWGGYGVTEPEFGKGINSVEGTFTEGADSSPASNSPGEESTWVGIGGGLAEGSSNYGLIQSGVAMITNYGYTSWWEVVGSSGCTTSANNYCYPVYNAYDSTRPGDDITDEVYWQSSSTACFVLTDYTHSTGSINVCEPALVPYDHTSAEWINENWLGSGYYYDNPGTISFTSQRISPSYGGTSYQSAFGGKFAGVIMEPSSSDNTVASCPDNTLLSEGTGASGTSSKIDTYKVTGCDA